MNDVLITADGLTRLKAELARLHADRTELVERIKWSPEHGGSFADDGEFPDDCYEQELLDWRIARLETRLRMARLVEPETDGELDIGERVRVRDLASGELLDFRIVGTGDSNPACGDISHNSPVGSALLGQRAGDIIEVKVPTGPIRLELVEVYG